MIACGIAQAVEIVDDECAGAHQQGPKQRSRRAERKAGYAREGDTNRGGQQAREGNGVGEGAKGHAGNRFARIMAEHWCRSESVGGTAAIGASR